jgi:nucleoside-triphosphatase THEP1
MKTVLLLTGMPGTGKTSLIKQAAASLGDRAGGFYTEEIRVRGVRQGFRIVTLNGRSAILASTSISSRYRVSKYGVDVHGLDEIGVASLLEAAHNREIVVIDEIGKMEFFSKQFRTVVSEIIDSKKKVLGTIMLKPDPVAEIIKQKPQVKILTVTRSNHQEILKEIGEWAGE